MKLISKFFKKKLPVVNIIRMSGIISSGSRFPSSSHLSLESLEKQIERAFEGKKVSGVALVINSPGGSPVQSALISERILGLSIIGHIISNIDTINTITGTIMGTYR